MAINIGVLKGAVGASKAEAKAQAAKVSWLARPLPLIGRLSFAKQLQILTTVLVALLVADGAIVALDTRQGTLGTIYVATVGKIQMLSQRLAKAAKQASQGNVEAFKQLKESRDEFAALMKLLSDGGEVAGVSVPATSGEARPALGTLDSEWKRNDRNATLVLSQERNLVALGRSVRQINQNNSVLQELSDEIAAL